VRKNLALFYRFRLSPSKIPEYRTVDPPRGPVPGHGLPAGGNRIEAEDVMRCVAFTLIVSLTSSFALCAKDAADNYVVSKLMVSINTPSHVFVTQYRSMYPASVTGMRHRERPFLTVGRAALLALATSNLRSNQYATREAAFQELKSAGLSAWSFLIIGAQSNDEETLHRCRELLRLLVPYFEPDVYYGPSE
jgi:hypothetical protein